MTYVYSHLTNEWSDGPRLVNGRYRFGCAKFKSAAHEDREVIVVAGGYAESNGYPFDSVEILDFTKNTPWKSGKFQRSSTQLKLIYGF